MRPYEAALKGDPVPAFRGRLAQSRGHQPFVFEPIERDVDAAHDDVATAALLDLVSDGDSVGLVAQTDQGQQHQELEAAEKFPPSHLVNNTD